MTTPGRQPDKNLREIPCEICKEKFTPYRSNQITCNRDCYRKLPYVAEKDSYRKKSPEARERKNAARRNDPNKTQKNFSNNVKKYGITVQDYEDMLESQNGLCAICKKSPNPDGSGSASRLHVDHDHETGKVRSLLCVRCNPGIGYFKNDPIILEAAAAYLRRHGK